MRIRAVAVMHARGMNRVEQQYEQHLRERLLVGEIRWYWFEPMKLRLADNTYYTPDFVVVGNDLALEAHEVKAEWSTGKPGWQEDARVKIKVAAEIFPIRFIGVCRMRDGSWEFEDFGKGHEEPKPPSDLELISQALGMAMVPTSWQDIVREIKRLRGQ
jgi:hypothetical protein